MCKSCAPLLKRLPWCAKTYCLNRTSAVSAIRLPLHFYLTLYPLFTDAVELENGTKIENPYTGDKPTVIDIPFALPEKQYDDDHISMRFFIPMHTTTTTGTFGGKTHPGTKLTDVRKVTIDDQRFHDLLDAED